MYYQIGLLWLLTPFVGGGAAYLTARSLRSDAVSEPVAVPLLGGVVGLIVVNITFPFLGSAPEGASIATALATVVSISGQVVTGGIDLGSMAVSLALAGALAAFLGREMRRDGRTAALPARARRASSVLSGR